MKKAIKRIIKEIIILYCNSFELTPAEALREMIQGLGFSIITISSGVAILQLSCRIIVFLAS